MDFFGAQDQARSRTKRLLALYVLCLIGITVSVHFAIQMILLFGAEEGSYLFDPLAFGMAAACTLTVIAVGTLYRHISLRRGGSAVAEMLGGRLVSLETKDPAERRLLNVVEEMSIASGVPMPLVYVLPEKGINAFAAGYSRSDAVVGVTEGCLAKLSRDELQGVMAHEFSHILNGDMRLNIKLLAVLNGILLIYIIGYGILRSAPRARGRNAGGAILAGLLFGVVIMAIGSIGMLFSRLIQSAVSRQREYLADAAAVQFTRNPPGIAGALKRIGAHSERSIVRHKESIETSHMFFAAAAVSQFGGSSAFASHPPLKKRIMAVEPSWDGSLKGYSKSGGLATATFETELTKSQQQAQKSKVAREFALPLFLLNSINVNDLPVFLHEQVHKKSGAKAYILGLLLFRNGALDEAGLTLVNQRLGESLAGEVRRCFPEIKLLQPGLRLPLLDLSMASLRQMSADEWKAFRAVTLEIIESDQKWDLFEVLVEAILINNLDRFFFSRRQQPITFYKLEKVAGSVRTVLAAVAHVGPTEAAAAYAEGFKRLPAVQPGIMPDEMEALRPEPLRHALQQLNLIPYSLRQLVLSACQAAINSDGKCAPIEREWLRGIAEALDCPMPFEGSSQ